MKTAVDQNAAGKVKRNRCKPKLQLPIPWGQLPHQEIWQRALDNLNLGSQARSREDSQRHVLKHRLSTLEHNIHFQYLEIECARVVEQLRALRDTYREVLTEAGCRPLAEMYWVVFRFGVIPASAKFLRHAYFEYIMAAKISGLDWAKLFGLRVPFYVPLHDGITPEKFTVASALGDSGAEESITREAVEKTLRSTTSEETLAEVTFAGGEFGREAQLRWSHRYPWPERLHGRLTMPEEVKLRQELWDRCRPWTEGLTRLYDVVQEEIKQQYGQLSADDRRADRQYIKLSPFQRVAYIRLKQMRKDSDKDKHLKFSDEQWLGLMQELDGAGVNLDAELSGLAQCVIRVLRKKGKVISTWQEASQPQLHATLEDGKYYSLKSLVQKAIHNAARSDAKLLGQI